MKTAIVTASTKGIGLATAKKLLLEGCRVYMSYLHDDSTAHELEKKLGENAIISKVDMTDYNAAINYAEYIINKEKKIDYIIFNTGITLKKKFGEIQYGEWCNVFNTNLNIPFFMIQKLTNYISDNGRVIFVSALVSIYAHSSSIAYGVSKAAVNSLSSYLVKYFGNRAITVNAVACGFTDTGMISRTPEHTERIKEKIALHRFASPEEIAQVIWHVIQDGYVNGSLIQVDGGYCYQ